jgi:hypothetical protein
VEYFRQSVGAELEVAGFRSRADLEAQGADAVAARLAAAPLVFAGPGSPTYALRSWRGTLVPALLAEKLTHGGALTFASAAALTLGVATVPVYEIYKVGEEPRWEPGLDLLTALGLRAAVIPHYDNAEGGTHDTRFCYLGEERLARLERSLPEGAFVLGVDEHTALFLDFEAGTASVSGRGGVTVRAAGRSTRLEPGDEVPIARLSDMARALASGGTTEPGAPTGATAAWAGTTDAPTGATAGEPDAGRAAGRRMPASTPAASPLLEAIRGYEEQFRAAKDAGQAAVMVRTALALEEELWQWRADTLQSDEADRGRAALRAMVGEIGSLAERGARDPAEAIGPFVELALGMRETARRQGRFDDADVVRGRLSALGVEVRDTPEGPRWLLAPSSGAGGDGGPNC